MKLKVLAYRIALRLMTYAGDLGSAEWTRMKEENATWQRRLTHAEDDRWNWIKKFDKLLDAAKLADGLISQGQTDIAQQQLRIAIIEGGGMFGRKHG